ncbi:MAG: TIGR04283 family arsenosugar biosynthesis glycosyltransferase [Myxococcota bacterium]
MAEIVTPEPDAQRRAASQVSLVIPALNEAQALSSALRAALNLEPPALELILVDGGSTDGTVTLAEEAGVRVLHAARGRALQMNLGAQVARGGILCFLHADTRLPRDAVAVMRHSLADPEVAAAGFTSLMEGPEGVRWVTSFHNFIKTYYAPLLFRPVAFFRRHLRLLFGDQAIFCRREDFESVGGYQEVPIMEEATLCERLGQRGRILQLSRTVRSSDRRVRRWGFWRAHATYLLVGFAWGLGISGRRLRRLYPDVR